MRFHRVWFLAIALSVGIFMLAPAASAWEINLDGNYTWQYEYRSGLGASGFFGPFDVDYQNGVGTAGQAASLNGWLGSQANYDQMVSGADGAWNVMYMTTNMDLRINPAIRVRGQYYIGSWAVPNSTSSTGTAGGYSGGTPDVAVGVGGNTVASWYYNYTAPGVQRSFSPGYWNTLWLTAQLPWGTLTLGKRGSIFGTGLAWNGVENRSSESTSLTAAYGPLRIGLSLYVAREGDDAYYNRFADKNNLRLFDTALPTLTYRDGPLDMGILCNFVRRHRGPERLIATGKTTASNNNAVRDRDEFYGGIYAKYNNGRFFFNGEFDWFDRLDRLSNAAATPLTTAPNASHTEYVQDYRLMTELGVMAGPTKVSLMASWLAGVDRRHGTTFNINQGPSTTNATRVATTAITPAGSGTVSDDRWQQSSLSNTGLYRPYSYLMVYSYGLGTYINNDTNNGFVSDAMTYAARLDYAVAANLNVYGSFFWADRVGNGEGWGYLAPNPTTVGTAGVLGAGNGRVRGVYRGTPANPAKSIPDNNLGWEVDAGFDWKLLEGLLVNATFAYWQPGKWFNYACVSKTNPLWDTPATDTTLWGTNPNRKIDPMFGMEIKVSAEF